MNYFEKLLRPNIARLKPYSSARDEYTGDEGVFLDANENPFNSPYNRYPDPRQRVLKAKIAAIKGVEPGCIFLGNGSDEPIDLMYRAFCEPGVDNVVSIDPTYGMYQVAADINNIEVRKVLLTADYQMDVPALLAAADDNTKLLFLCSPNNPTGNCFHIADIEAILKGFKGMVVLDEAYIDFAPGKSFLPRLAEFPNLVILQTFSKAWGMAGLRLGMAFASPELVQVLSKIKYPYNLNILTQQTALELLDSVSEMENWVKLLLNEREVLSAELAKLPFVKKQYPSDSNFLLVKTEEPRKIYQYLVGHKIIIRDRSSVALCEGCLRITVGSPDENRQLLDALKKY
ncbi:histidinol-phosphate aminotransferase [Breznakibacter xylanolyticus]|uniref:Histidinol-phosphate aminotransferase n=1 Tax=Breznakibacter xylanolyticus TaxID=990 RepID=A0A2W7NVP5_9BACT|nr:histidinol-phosphate transaminase [Breznakibacter xylanolyticus]PZX17376.1 histidinol-phosphate aminotransferase [Breznakibacter xylanolyticus]